MKSTMGWFALLITLIGVSPSRAQELSTKQVVDNMDQRAKMFSSLDASVSRTFTEYGVKAEDETGRIYMKKASPSHRIFYDVTAPAANRKTVLIDKGIGTIYFRNTNSYRTQPVGSANEVTELLMIGFGAGSETFGKSYSPAYKGRETLNGVQTVVLELSAKDQSAQFRTITLWLDPSTWTPLQTRVSQSSKTYSDFKYSNVRLNRGVADSVFKLDIPSGATKQ
jgi:outer membrane lipoprotein-sorting protein